MKWWWFTQRKKSKHASFDTYQEQDLMQALKEAHEEVLTLQTKVGEYKWLEETLRMRTRELSERVKELGCLYTITTYLTNHNLTIDQMLDFVVREMPHGWQNPKATCARIVFGEREYKSPHFHQTSRKQSAFICKDGKQLGMLEVCLLPEPILNDEKPFLHEEQELLNAIALWLGEFVGHRKMMG